MNPFESCEPDCDALDTATERIACHERAIRCYGAAKIWTWAIYVVWFAVYLGGLAAGFSGWAYVTLAIAGLILIYLGLFAIKTRKVAP